MLFFFSSRRRHTRCALVTGVQTCALPIYERRLGCQAPVGPVRPYRGFSRAASARRRCAPSKLSTSSFRLSPNPSRRRRSAPACRPGPAIRTSRSRTTDRGIDNQRRHLAQVIDDRQHPDRRPQGSADHEVERSALVRPRRQCPFSWIVVIPHASRSEEHTSELQSLMRISSAVFCLKKKKKNTSLTSNNR